MKSATALTAAAAAYTSQPLLADIHGAKPKPEKLSLGVKPEGVTAGPVIVETDNQTHVTFYGCEEDKRGRDLGDGTVVISLKGCKTWRFRSPDDEAVPSHSTDLESLDSCEIYQVKNSDWNPGQDQGTDPTPQYSPQQGGPQPKQNTALNHYVITFLGLQPGVTTGGMHFECLAEGLSEPACIQDADFDVLVASLELGDVNQQPETLSPEPTRSNRF